MKNTLLSLFSLLGLWIFSASAGAQDIQADPVAGEKNAATCIGCHGIPGYQSSFPEVHKVPMISGQSAGYIAAALNGYAKGDRKHPTMRSVAGSLSAQDMADLGAFYQQHTGALAPAPEALDKEPPQAVAQLLVKGACVGCHGTNFSKPVSGAIPKLAGQHADYLYVALKSYQTQGNPHIGRNNGSMMGMVSSYTHSELRLLANYIASLPGDLRVVPQSRFR
jgi:cytochrome c553